VSSWVSNAAIDRETDTKQNIFAKFLTPSRFGNGTITLDTVMTSMHHTIANILFPDAKQPRESIRRMVIRESLAPNGRLVQVAPGAWKLREQILEPMGAA
jgi:hypothetical protein